MYTAINSKSLGLQIVKMNFQINLEDRVILNRETSWTTIFMSY